MVQQKFDPDKKILYWDELDPWLANDIYLAPRFYEYFKSHSYVEINGLYPIVTVRKLMWALRMKPLKKEIWEGEPK